MYKICHKSVKNTCFIDPKNKYHIISYKKRVHAIIGRMFSTEEPSRQNDTCRLPFHEIIFLKIYSQKTNFFSVMFTS